MFDPFRYFSSLKNNGKINLNYTIQRPDLAYFLSLTVFSTYRTQRFRNMYGMIDPFKIFSRFAYVLSATNCANRKFANTN